jgi:hypothetical protein
MRPPALCSRLRGRMPGVCTVCHKFTFQGHVVERETLRLLCEACCPCAIKPHRQEARP